MNTIKELSTGSGEEVAARRTDWTAWRKASRRAADVKRDGIASGCMSHMISARLILELAMVASDLC